MKTLLFLAALAVSSAGIPAPVLAQTARTTSPYQAARATARQGEASTALRQLEQAVASGYYSEEMLREEADFASLTAQPGWPALLTQARRKQQRYEAGFNQPLMALIRKINHQDQHFRQLATAADKQYGPNSPQTQAAMMQQSRLDVRLIQQVDSLIGKHGYPGKSLVGEYRKSVAFLVIQHNPDEKYLPLLAAAADKGELNWSSVAMLIDRLKTEKGEKQMYGSQLHDGSDKKRRLEPIEDEPNVNVRRAKAGMEPLEDYLKQFGITYQVPTATHNPKPPALYVVPRAETEEEKSPVELIGGYDKLYASLRYPALARQNNVTGQVTVQLRIDPQGVPQDVMVVRGLGSGCDEEALRVIRAARFTNAAGQDHEIRMSLPFPYVAGAGK